MVNKIEKLESFDDFRNIKDISEEKDEITEKLKDFVGKGEDEIKMSDDDGYVTLTQKYDGDVHRILVGTESIPAIIKFLQKVK